MSEEIKYCNICNYLGLDFKTGSFYCSLSHRKDNLPDVLSCKDFKTSNYIQRLKQENERLQMLSCANCGEKYLSSDGAELYEKIVQLQKENEELKAKKGRCAFKCLDNTFCDEAKIKIDKLELDKDCLNVSLETARKYRGIAEADRDKYKQALEEIRSYCDEQNLKADYTACYITNRIDEVLKCQ